MSIELIAGFEPVPVQGKSMRFNNRKAPGIKIKAQPLIEPIGRLIKLIDPIRE
jgi:hypothetical protein